MLPEIMSFSTALSVSAITHPQVNNTDDEEKDDAILRNGAFGLYMLSLIGDNLEGLPIKVPRPYHDSIFRGQQRIAEYLDTRGGNGMVDVMGVNQAEFFLINDVLNQMEQNISTREMFQIERMAVALYYLKGGIKVGMRHTAEFWQRSISTVWA